MEKSLFEQMNGTYTQVGDYLLPNLILSEQQGQPIGVWGQRHARYLKQRHKIIYMNLLTSGKLNAHLAEIDRQAEDMFSQLVKQIAECEGVTEQLKAENQMEWVRRMNNIRNIAAGIINHELILKYFSKKLFNLSMTVCFFNTLLEPPENLDIGGNILSRSVPVVFISPSLNEFSINF